MKSIEKRFVKQVKLMNRKFIEDKQVKEFEKSATQFNELVKKGIIQKRGYNLLSPTDAHVKSQVTFNAE